ncbi:MAG: molybdenum cofactor guanylyltransferase [Actinomycetota bacterium]|nr:molybdenum cofactor guanylyltransferase [Actinomycetota bacterium]
MPPFAAVVLAGGSGRRLGGVDKPALRVGERTLLEAVLLACARAEAVVVVGPPRDLPAGIVQVREEPPGGGPVPALRTSLPRVTAPYVAVLAADLPLLDAATVDRLRGAAQGRDGALLLDDQGCEQWLCGVWRTDALRGALDALTTTRLRDALRGLDAVRLTTPGQPWFDCDTEADLAVARARCTPDRAR